MTAPTGEVERVAAALEDLIHDAPEPEIEGVLTESLALLRSLAKDAERLQAELEWRQAAITPEQGQQVLMWSAYSSDNGYRFGYYDRGLWIGPMGSLGGITHWLPVPPVIRTREGSAG
jgi:hypothetical protein